MKRTWKRALATLLTIAMMATLLVVPAAAAAGDTYTLDFGTEGLTTADLAANKTAGTDGYFTVTPGTITTQSADFGDDGGTMTTAWQADGNYSKDSLIKNYVRNINFTTAGAATITVWWYTTSNGRAFNIYAADGATIEATNTLANKGAEKAVVKVANGGVHYLAIASSNTACYIYKIEVVENGATFDLKTAEGMTNGTVKFTVDGEEVTKAAAGDVVTATAVADSGYALDGALTSEDVTIAGDGTFTMPAKAVTVSATFVSTCDHSGTSTSGVDAVAATCAKKGHTGKTVCDNCGAVLNEGEETDYAAHSFGDDHICTVCNAVDESADGVKFYRAGTEGNTFFQNVQEESYSDNYVYNRVTNTKQIKFNNGTSVDFTTTTTGTILVILASESSNSDKGLKLTTTPTGGTATTTTKDVADHVIKFTNVAAGAQKLERNSSTSQKGLYIAFIPDESSVPPAPATRAVSFTATKATVSEVKQGETELELADGKYTANTTDAITFKVTADTGYVVNVVTVLVDDAEEPEALTAGEDGVTYTIPGGEGDAAVTITAAQQKSATPDFQETEVQLLKDKKVTLTLTATPAAGTVYRIYAAADSTTPAGTAGSTGVTAVGNKITFTLQNMPNADATYYVRATEPGKAASANAPIDLKTYVPAIDVNFKHAKDGEITHVIYLGGTGTGTAENHDTANEPKYPSAWKLSATVEPENATDKTYTISNGKDVDDCITVSADGTVIALKVGTGTVELDHEDVQAKTATIIVKPKLDDITVKNGGTAVGADGVTLALGGTATLTAEVVFPDTVTSAMVGNEGALDDYKAVEWAVKTGSDVIGLSNGAITTKKAGSATITVSDADGQIAKEITVTVDKGAPVLTITPASANVASGDTVTLKVNGAKGMTPTLTFKQGEEDKTSDFTVPTGVDDGNGNFTFTGITVPGNDTSAVVTYTVTASVAGNDNWEAATTATAGTVKVQPAGAKVIEVTAPAGSHGTAAATVGQSEAVTLSVTASVDGGDGSEMLAYAWSKGGEAIPSATGSSYTVPAADLATAGTLTYKCVVSVDGDATVEPAEVDFDVTVSNPALTGITVTGAGYTDGQTLALVGPGAVVLTVAKDPANADGNITLSDNGTAGVVTGKLENGQLTITPSTVTTAPVDIVLSCGDVTKTIQVTVAKAAAPNPDVAAADLTATAPTAEGGQGTITVDATKFPGATFMYKAVAATSWTEMTGNTASVAPGNYLVRVKVANTALQNTSEGAAITVPAYTPALTVTSVNISGESSVAVEGTLQLEAEVHMSDNTVTDAVSWTSNDTAKATVSNTGLVTGVAEGSVTITATSTVDASKTATKTITVTAKSAGTPCDKAAVDSAISAARAEMKKYGAGATAADVFEGKKVVSEATMKALTDKIAQAVAASNASKDKTIVVGDALDTSNKATVAALNAAVEAFKTEGAASTVTGTKTDAGAKVLTGDAVFTAAAADTTNWTKNSNTRYDTKAAYTMRVADYFDVCYKSGGRVDASGAGVFADGYEGAHRINLNEKMGTATGFVSFTVAEGKTADVKLWWVCNNASNTMTLKSATATVPAPEGAVQLGTPNVAAIATWKDVPAGTYQLGGDNGANYIFRVEVVEKDAGDTPETKDITFTVPAGAELAELKVGGQAATLTGGKLTVAKDAVVTFKVNVTDDAKELGSVTGATAADGVYTVNAAAVVITLKNKGEAPTVDKTALNAAIAAAEALADVEGSDDGTDVSTSKEWVATAKREALDTALTEAKSLAADATQEQVTAAAEKLAAAVKDVTDNKAAGTKTGGGGSRPAIGTGTTPSGNTTATNPDGAKVSVSTNKDGVTTAEVTVPSGVDKTTVTIPVAQPSNTLVPVIVNADGTEEIVRMSAVTEDGVALTLDKSATVKLVNNAKEFVDVPGHWAEKSVDFTTARELFNGTDTTHFTPNGAMTRGMMATVLFRLDGENKGQAAADFTDVADTWYTDAVAWAAERGVVNGYGNGTFLPEKSINREELAVMVYRYAKALGLGYAAGQEIPDLTYADADQVSEWAYEAISWLTANGVLNGKPGNVVDAAGLASRAEVSTVLERFVKLAK